MYRYINILTNRPLFVTMVYSAILLIGIATAVQLPIELSPSVEFPRITISTYWGNTSPETMESIISSPIEELCNTINGVKRITSISQEGLSRVTVEFGADVKMNFAVLDLNEKLASLTELLPYDVSPPRIQKYIPEDFEKLQGFITYTISAPYSNSEIRKIVEQKMLTELMSIEGVANVQIYGGAKKEIQIELDHEKLNLFQIGLKEIQDVMQGFETITSLGNILEGGKKTNIRIFNKEFETPEIGIEQINKHPLKILNDGRIIYLEDIGIVNNEFEAVYSYYRINGKSAVTIQIDKEPHVNIVTTADRVIEKMAALEKKLPSNFNVIKEIDKSETIRKDINKISNRSIFSVIFIFSVLMFAFLNFRAPIIVISSILFSVLLTFIAMYFLKLSINIITLAGLTLAFGLIVDNSIVVVENISRYNRLNTDRSMALYLALNDIALPIFAATLTTVGALIPIYFLSPEVRLYFEQFAITVNFALLFSLIVAYSFVPLASYKYFRFEKQDSMLIRLQERLTKIYERILAKLIKFKKISIILTIWIFGIPTWLLPEKIETPVISPAYNLIFSSKLYSTIKPYVDHTFGGSLHLFFKYVNRGEIWSWGAETYLLVTIRTPAGTELERLNEAVKLVENELSKFDKNIDKYVTNIYNNEIGNITITIPEENAQSSFPYVLKAHLISFMSNIGGATVGVLGFGPGFFTGSSQLPSYNIKILGYNYEKVKEIAEQIRQKIIINRRVANVDVDRSFMYSENLYEVALVANRKLVEHYGLSVADLMHRVRMLSRGAVQTTRIKVAGEEINYSIKFSGYKDFSLDDLMNVVITTKKSEGVKLKDIISVKERKVLSRIVRENQQYQRYVSFEYKGPYKYGQKLTESVVTQVKNNVPHGYSVEQTNVFFFLTPEKEIELGLIIFLAILIVYMVTAALFESYLKPFIIILSVPFSMIGVLLTFYFSDATFDRGGYASVLLLTGISVNISILLVTRLSKIESTDFIENVIKGSASRLRPILITTLTTIAGVLPLVIEETHDSFWHSLALGTIGGLISATLLVLFIIPVIYTLLYNKKLIG
ncbi:MAG: efflux RND transporter permease subunit [Bacteroidota bacterium]|nr:efflux RND transporter permease subunit [Bacteroidota bacterium]